MGQTATKVSDLFYVAIRPCGCCTGASSIEPAMAKANADFVRRCGQDGRRVEIKPTAWVREHLKRCNCSASEQ